MSDLLNSASLVLIPSGYKEDVVYSQIPLDGSGDLQLTRASNGTRVNSAGLVEVCPWNLLSYSEQFDNTSGWLVQNGASITANSTTAPNGTTTADTISFSTDSISACYQSVTNNAGVFTISVYAKCASGTQKFKFIIYNGTDGQIDGSVFTVTTEWQRFEQIFTVTQSSNWYIANGNDAVARSIYIWGAQLNIGSTAKPYFPTTDRLNVPRLTYQNGGGGCPSLLLEKQSTNLVKYSEQLDNTGQWNTFTSGTGSVTITANYATSPDGTQNADRLQLIGGSGYAFLGADVTVTNGATYTYSVWLKALSGTPNVAVIYDGSTVQRATLTSEWVRYTFNFVGTGGNTYPRVGVWQANWGTSLNADVLAWGAQLEAGSYPTSYIPTTSASATRVADFATTNNISSLFGSTEGSFFIEMTADFTNTNGSIPLFLRSSINSTFNRATYLQFGSGTIALNVYLAGALEASIFSGTYTEGQKLKIAFAYKQNDFVLYINGSLIGTDTSGNISASLAFIDLGTYSLAASTFQYNGAISEAVLFPTRLTNTQLAQLTA